MMNKNGLYLSVSDAIVITVIVKAWWRLVLQTQIMISNH